MLPHYSPFKVAENFSLLAGPVPGPDRPRDRPRVGHRPAHHLRAAARPPPGLARRLPAAARRAARALRPHACRPTTRSPGSATRSPAATRSREIWLLGSSAQSAIWAAQLAPAVRVRRLHQPDAAPRSRAATASGPSTRTRRSACGRSPPRPTRRPSASRPRSRWRWRCCARTARSRCRRRRRRCATSRRTRQPAGGRRRIVGSPETVRTGSRRSPPSTSADEVIIVTITYDHGARRRSYELIAEAFGLAHGSGRSGTSGCCRLSSSPSSRRPASSG